MMTYKINGTPFEFDETLRYLDFHATDGKRTLELVRFDTMLTRLQSGVATFEDNDLVGMLIYLDRWVCEAERKRFYRKLKLEGLGDGAKAHVLSTEYWFEDRADGNEIIDALANTGEVARRLLEAFLPEQSARCKQNPHPASVLYPDP